MSDVTRVLTQIESGDPSAAELLLPLVYDELRKLAAARLAQEKPGQTLQATAPGARGVLAAGGRRAGEVGGQEVRGRMTTSNRNNSDLRSPTSDFWLLPSTPAATSLPPRPRRCGGF